MCPWGQPRQFLRQTLLRSGELERPLAGLTKMTGQGLVHLRPGKKLAPEALEMIVSETVGTLGELYLET